MRKIDVFSLSLPAAIALTTIGYLYIKYNLHALTFESAFARDEWAVVILTSALFFYINCIVLFLFKSKYPIWNAYAIIIIWFACLGPLINILFNSMLTDAIFNKLPYAPAKKIVEKIQSPVKKLTLGSVHNLPQLERFVPDDTAMLSKSDYLLTRKYDQGEVYYDYIFSTLLVNRNVDKDDLSLKHSIEATRNLERLLSQEDWAYKTRFFSFRNSDSGVASLGVKYENDTGQIWIWDSLKNLENARVIPINLKFFNLGTISLFSASLHKQDWFLADARQIWKIKKDENTLETVFSSKNNLILGFYTTENDFYILENRSNVLNLCVYTENFIQKNCLVVNPYFKDFSGAKSYFYKKGDSLYVNYASVGLWKINLTSFEIDSNFEVNLTKTAQYLDQVHLSTPDKLILINVGHDKLILRYGIYILSTDLNALNPQLIGIYEF